MVEWLKHEAAGEIVETIKNSCEYGISVPLTKDSSWTVQWKRRCWKWRWSNFNHHFGINLERLGKTTTNSSWGNSVSEFRFEPRPYRIKWSLQFWECTEWTIAVEPLVYSDPSGLHNHRTSTSTMEARKCFGDSTKPITELFGKCPLYHSATKVPRFP
jgi:hypothetical protein